MSWHALENIVSPYAPMSVWLDRSGMNFDIKSANVEFLADNEFIQMKGKRVLYRGDNNVALSVVSDSYQIVQPKEIMGFFFDMCKRHGLHMDTAGVIRNSTKFWCLANTGSSFSIGDDVVKQYLLMATSADMSMATTGKHTAMRVVCSNTFHANVNNAEPAVKVNHSRQFDPTAMEIDLGLMTKEFAVVGETVEAMGDIKVKDPAAKKFYAELVSGKSDMTNQEINQTHATSRIFKNMLNSYKKAPGAQNTVWGLFNGVTHMVDHVSARNTDNRINSALFGAGALMKQNAWKKAVEMVYA